MVTRMPWEFCHAHAIDDQTCDLNRRFVEYVEGWLGVCRNVAVYDYYGHFHAFTPWPLVHSIRRDLPFLRGLGVRRFMSETQQNWANQGLNFYVGAKLSWDPALDVDALLDDYFTRFYGRAAGPMREYWLSWERSMQDTAQGAHGGYAWQAMFTPARVAESGRLLDAAEHLAAEDRERVRQRVARARAGFRFTEAWTRMRDRASRWEWSAAVAAGEEALRLLKESHAADGLAFELPLAVSQTEAVLKPYQALAGAAALVAPTEAR
jgi:hypothetical protein